MLHCKQSDEGGFTNRFSSGEGLAARNLLQRVLPLEF